MPNASLNAIAPDISATVSASAGTGKTWLLVSRIVRLLLDGAEPKSLLAITFTRKAAAEMQSRLLQRLLDLASYEDSELAKQLQAIGAAVDPGTLLRARRLYEQLQHSQYAVKITTFHAFCQDLLKQFPFEADVPPGFELAEQTVELRNAAWEALTQEAQQAPAGDLAQALDRLFEHCNGLTNTQDALNNFLSHSSDWLAYTHNQAEPVEFAYRRLKRQLDLDDNDNPLARFFSDETAQKLREFADLLSRHATDKNTKASNAITRALQIQSSDLQSAFQLITSAFLTAAGQPQARKHSAAAEKNLGASGIQRFLQLHEQVCALLLKTLNQRAKLNTLRLSHAWYLAGHNLLRHYQRIKNERRTLDFADLEWQTYLLLNEAQNAHWVQYKLDARIDHVLIDEFQDTNPTQWHLLIPLLTELTAQTETKPRTVFLVGDAKQSIYRFRRAEPRIFTAARDWIETRVAAFPGSLSVSWRSAPAIMELVNILFSDGSLGKQIEQFQKHDTHHRSRWGRVEVLPIISAEQSKSGSEASEPPATAMRNPLLLPRRINEDTRHSREARLIAERIRELVTSGLDVGNGCKKRIGYSDIIILLRHRTHARDYEKALQAAAIPYLGTERGSLLSTYEIRDMVCLLEVLVTPFNNLSMATVLRSPLFSFANDDLVSLAQLPQTNWYERLAQLAQQPVCGRHITRAFNLLSQWRNYAGFLPVHDLLDRIFLEANLIKRYEAASPAHLRHRIRANLYGFLQLALDLDSGRYPSISRFLFQLQTLRSSAQDAPDEVPNIGDDAHVRIMTIHGAKGLEAPVVFLADSANNLAQKIAYQAMVTWPADSNAPQRFFLAAKKTDLDSVTKEILATQATEIRREEANLLYVALTRAKSLLIISGCEPNKGQDLGWYGTIIEQMQAAGSAVKRYDDGRLVLESGVPAYVTEEPAVSYTNQSVQCDPRLTQKLILPTETLELAPSRSARQHSGQISAKPLSTEEPQPALLGRIMENNALLRGLIIHRILYLLNESYDKPAIRRIIHQEYSTQEYPALIDQCYDEACKVVEKPALEFLFAPKRYSKAYNEVPIYFRDHNQPVYGIIDRLVIDEGKVYILDYKTQSDGAMADKHTEQMRHYFNGVKKLYKNRDIYPYILFTETGELVPVNINQHPGNIPG